MAAIQHDAHEAEVAYQEVLRVSGWDKAEGRVVVTLGPDGSIERVAFGAGGKLGMTGAQINAAINLGLAEAVRAAWSAEPGPLSAERRDRLLDELERRQSGGPRAFEPRQFVTADGNVKVASVGGRVVSAVGRDDWLAAADEVTISRVLSAATAQALAERPGS